MTWSLSHLLLVGLNVFDLADAAFQVVIWRSHDDLTAGEMLIEEGTRFAVRALGAQALYGLQPLI